MKRIFVAAVGGGPDAAPDQVPEHDHATVGRAEMLERVDRDFALRDLGLVMGMSRPLLKM